MSETETPDLEGLAARLDARSEYHQVTAWTDLNPMTHINTASDITEAATALRWAAAEIARERARADAAEALLREAGAEMSFLVGRLRDWEVLSDMSKDIERDWYGHVEPSRARARALADKIRERGK